MTCFSNPALPHEILRAGVCLRWLWSLWVFCSSPPRSKQTACASAQDSHPTWCAEPQRWLLKTQAPGSAVYSVVWHTPRVVPSRRRVEHGQRFTIPDDGLTEADEAMRCEAICPCEASLSAADQDGRIYGLVNETSLCNTGINVRQK